MESLGSWTYFRKKEVNSMKEGIKQKMVDTGGRVSRFNKKFGLG